MIHFVPNQDDLEPAQDVSTSYTVPEPESIMQTTETPEDKNKNNYSAVKHAPEVPEKAYGYYKFDDKPRSEPWGQSSYSSY